MQEETEHDPSPAPSSNSGQTTYFDIEEINNKIAQIIEKEHNRTPEGIKYAGQRIDAYLNQCYKDQFNPMPESTDTYQARVATPQEGVLLPQDTDATPRLYSIETSNNKYQIVLES